MTIPAKAGTGALYTKTLIQGTGPKLTTSDSLLGNFVLYDWSGKTHKLIGSTYTDGVPTLFTGSLLPGLETALEGQKVGSRVLAVIPPADAFGTAGNSEIGVGPNGHRGLRHRHDQVVHQHRGRVAARRPPTAAARCRPSRPALRARARRSPSRSTAAPKTLQVKTLIKGTGPVVKKGHYIVVQYTGVN